MSIQTKFTYPVKLAALTVLGLAAANWYYAPDKAGLWASLMVAALAAIGATILLSRRRKTPPDVGEGKIPAALFGASLILAGSLAAGLANEVGLINADAEERASGIIMGMVLIVTGNFLPKVVRPLNKGACDQARAKAAERFTGWAFVIAGIFYALVWMFAPVDHANSISSLAAVSAFISAFAAWVWLVRGKLIRNQY